jgi:RNA ligase (TIGR02306 family)
MATFEVKVLPVKIEAHPNADSLEVACIGDFRAIVRKGDFGNGDHVAYIPEGAVVPDDVIAEMGLTGRLAGPDKNRVKAVKLRGVLSQGLCYPARKGWRKGDDVAAELGIFKFEPVVPAGFAGELQLVGGARTIHYDIENLKKYPDVFREGEKVVFTEKLHGTFAIMGVMGETMRLFHSYSVDAVLIVASKGIAAKGMSFKVNAPANANNLYVRTARNIDVVSAVERGFGTKQSVYLMGEIFGPGVQDLTYGLTQASFRIFDIYLGNPGEGRFLDDADLDTACLKMGIPRVPVLYRGPFSKAEVEKWTNGKETISGAHVREGIVIRSQVERTGVEDLPCWGRAQLKSVSEGYLLRKGDVTEFA